MWCTCYHVGSMSKMIQIRNVPDSLHTKLKIRAAQLGLSLSDYLKRELERTAETPTRQELLERLQQLPPVHFSEPIEELVRKERDSH